MTDETTIVPQESPAPEAPAVESIPAPAVPSETPTTEAPDVVVVEAPATSTP